MRRLIRRVKPLLAIGIPLLILVAVGVVLQVVVVAQPLLIAHWLQSFGPALLVIYFLIQSVGIIFPPIPGGIFQLALIAIFGPLKGFLLIYLTVTPLYCVNFLLAKRYGRPFVTRMIGEKSMRKVDDYAKDAGLGGLIMLKLFQDRYVDYISYGLGLTLISFKNFFWVNLLAEIPRDIVAYFIFKNGPNFTVSIILMEVFAGGLTVLYILHHHWQHRRKLASQKSRES